MYLPTEYCLLQCVPSRCPAFNCCHSTTSAGVIFFRNLRRRLFSAGMLLVLFTVIFVVFNLPPPSGTPSLLRGRVFCHFIFLLFWKRRGTACGGGDGYLQGFLISLRFARPSFLERGTVLWRVLFLFESHHCPAVVLGIVKVLQAVLCGLGLQDIHILGVETADKE